MSVVISLILLAVGVFVVFTVVNETDTVANQSAGTTTTTNTYTETFETDTHGADPSDTWYTYTEVGWEWANVTTADAHGGTKSYIINGSSDLNNWTNFTLTSDDYEYFEYWFQIDNGSHDELRTYLLDENNDTICRVDTLGSTLNYIRFRNYTTIGWNQTLTNMSWYKIRYDFNYTDNTVRARLYNASSVLLNDSWLIASDASGTVDYSSFYVYDTTCAVGSSSYMFFDDLTLYDTDSTTTAAREYEDVGTTANTVFTILGIVLIVGAIMAIIGLMSKYR